MLDKRGKGQEKKPTVWNKGRVSYFDSKRALWNFIKEKSVPNTFPIKEMEQLADPLEVNLIQLLFS